MARPNLNYWDYVKAAFHLRVPVRGLGALPINKLALWGAGILGIAHPGFWLLGLALESAYLLYVPSDPRFQNLTLGLELQKAQQAFGTSQTQVLSSLPPAMRTRFVALEASCQSLLGQARRLGAIGMADLKSDELSQLSWIFLKLLASRQRISEVLAQTSRRDLQNDTKRIEDQVKKEPENSPLAKSLGSTLEIQKRRLEILDRAEEGLKVVDAELDRIEKQVTLLGEETAITSDAAVLTSRLDAVMQSLQGTSEWMTQNAELFGSLDDKSPPPMMPAVKA